MNPGGVYFGCEPLGLDHLDAVFIIKLNGLFLCCYRFSLGLKILAKEN